MLEDVPQVDSVKFIPDEEAFVVSYSGDSLKGEELKEKVLSAVIFPAARKAFSVLGQRFSRNN